MSTIDLIFLFLFLPISLVIYYLVSDNLKELVLLILSLLFYLTCSPVFFPFFIVLILITVAFGRIVYSKMKTTIKTLCLCLGIILNCCILVYYKYNFIIISLFKRFLPTESQYVEIVLPVGISFLSFKAISYLIDIYRKKTTLSDNPVHDFLYLSFFPQVQSGPISRYSELINYKSERISLFCDGVNRFLAGFIKKVLFAGVLYKVTSETFNTPFDDFSTSFAWFGSICYSIQLYYDFSGYSDMAIGLTELFGYKCRENFFYPYATDSVSEFWRRWHISLGQWFRDYIYIPMGGSRTKRKWKLYYNLLTVWILTGIWHGASWNFIIWGLLYFIVISIEKALSLQNIIKSKTAKTIYRVFTLLFINFQWVIFNSENLTSALKYIYYMIIYHANELTDKRTIILLKDYGFVFVMAILLSFPIIPHIEGKLKNKKGLFYFYEIVKTIIIMVLFVWSVSLIITGQYNPFVYVNF